MRNLHAEVATVSPDEVVTYLRSTGWKRVEEIGSKGSVWTFTNEQGDTAEILLPENRELGDFQNRMAEVIYTLAIVEGRNESAIITNLASHKSDILRFRIASADTQSGTVALTQATALARGVETLLLSAASAVAEPKPYYPRMNVSDAKEFLKKCRMGQSERGSFVLTVLSPVSPVLASPNGLFPDYELEESFERKVVTTLFNSLFHLQQALLQGTAEALNHTVSKGVSANLCEALTLMQPEDQNGELDIGVTWSPIRPVTQSPPTHRIQFASRVFPLLGESSRYLRRNAPIDNFELRGTIRKLESNNPQEDGKITVYAMIDERWANVGMELSPDQYRIAVQAHSERSPIYCKGELVKEGKGYRLLHPRDVRMEVAE